MKDRYKMVIEAVDEILESGGRESEVNTCRCR
jgi:hypothetical protein